MYMRYHIGFAPGHTGIWPSQLALRQLQSMQASPHRQAGNSVLQHLGEGSGKDGDDDGAEEDEDGER